VAINRRVSGTARVARIAIRRLKVPFSCCRVTHVKTHIRSYGQERTVEPVHLGCKLRGAVLGGVENDDGLDGLSVKAPVRNAPVCRPVRVLGRAWNRTP
jgi:hypothetical protein